MNREAALVVFSGGQDSTTCLFWAKRNFKKVYALSFLYGQKHQKEVELAREDHHLIQGFQYNLNPHHDKQFFPVTIRVVKAIKKIDGSDVYDTDISYNVLKVNESAEIGRAHV